MISPTEEEKIKATMIERFRQLLFGFTSSDIHWRICEAYIEKSALYEDVLEYGEAKFREGQAFPKDESPASRPS